MYINQHPHSELTPYVRCYWDVRYEVPAGETHYLPFGCVGHMQWVLYLENIFRTTFDTGRTLANHTSTLVGQMMQPVTHELSASTHAFVVDFTPIGFYYLSGQPVHELSGQTAETEFVLGTDAFDLTDQLQSAPNSAVRFGIMDAFLLRRLSKTPRFDHRIGAAVELIEQQLGNLTIRQLSHYLNCPERTLNRRFTEVVGLSPKSYVRVQRFLKTRQWLAQHPVSHWPDLLMWMGYYDQAHLINEFRYFTGKTPVLYKADGQPYLEFMRED